MQFKDAANTMSLCGACLSDTITKINGTHQIAPHALNIPSVTQPVCLHEPQHSLLMKDNLSLAKLVVELLKAYGTRLLYIHSENSQGCETHVSNSIPIVVIS